jgi:hypothetical protein
VSETHASGFKYLLALVTEPLSPKTAVWLGFFTSPGLGGRAVVEKLIIFPHASYSALNAG